MMNREHENIEEVEICLLQRANQADYLIEELKRQIADLKRDLGRKCDGGDLEALKKENKALKQDVETWKNKLIMAELLCGIRQIPVPVRKFVPSESVISTSVPEEKPVQPTKLDKPKQEKTTKEKAKDEKIQKEQKPKGDGKKGKEQSEEGPVDVSRLDFRIGKILSVKKHPDADTLYVEEVDVGEEKTRTVVSGLVKHVSMEEMQDRVVLMLCNLKPVKMRGVTSEAMVMCASTPEKVEILIPPPDAVPGDLVEVEEFSRRPDPVLNPKKKIFETVAPDLKVDEKKTACYKGKPLVVPGKGIITSFSLTGVVIK